MPFVRPSLPTLIERAVADTESKLPGADARLRRSNLNVLSRVNAGAAHGLYGFVAWIAKQILPDSADEEVLQRHASLWLETGRVPASYALGQITVTGTNGSVIETNTVFKRADGFTYLSEEEAVIAAGQAVVTIVAQTEGQAGNTAAGVKLTLDSPIVGVNALATVTVDGIVGGADVEEIESLRDRVLDRIRNTPHGGAKHDYVAWAKEVPGVTRAWCYPEAMGSGTVTVRFVRDNDASLIPDAGEVAAVQAYIEALKPVGAHLYVVAPVPEPLNFQIELTPDDSATRAAVEASLRDMLIREAIPEDGNGSGKILISHLREAVSLAAGETDHVMASPSADITPTAGKMVTFGAITWL